MSIILNHTPVLSQYCRIFGPTQANSLYQKLQEKSEISLEIRNHSLEIRNQLFLKVCRTPRLAGRRKSLIFRNFKIQKQAELATFW